MKKLLFGGTLLLLAFMLSACGSAPDQNNLSGGCSKETKTCADGSVVTRTGENCEFTPCPEEAAASDMIRVFNPGAGEVITRPLQIIGEARGPWFFEASFLIQLLDGKGNLIGQTIATAESDWMTEDYVPFSALMEYPLNVSGAGTLVFIKNNPSGLTDNDAQLRLPILLTDTDNNLLETENLPAINPSESGEQINPDQAQAQEVKLYYYNAHIDQDEAGNLRCSPTALGSVSRELSPTDTPIADTIQTLILGGLGQAELDAAYEKDGDHHRRIAGHGIAVENFLERHEHGIEQGGKRHEHAEVGPEAQGNGGKRANAADGEIEQVEIIPVRLAGATLLAGIGDADGRETDPGKNALHEPVAFGQQQYRFDDPAGHEPVIPGIELYFWRGDPVEQAVEKLGRGFLEPGIRTAVLADAVDDIVAGFPFFDEGRDDLGRVLQIGVDGNDDRSRGILQAGGEG